MKRHLIAAVLGLAASMPALADPFVGNNAAQSPVGAPFPGETSPADDRQHPVPVERHQRQHRPELGRRSGPRARPRRPRASRRWSPSSPPTPARSRSASGSAPTRTTSSATTCCSAAPSANDAVGMTIFGNTLDVFGSVIGLRHQVQLRHLHQRADQPELVRLLLPGPRRTARPTSRSTSSTPARAPTASSPSRTAPPPTGCSPTRTAPTGTTTTWPSRSSRSRPCRSPRPTR